jgi:hypothetical protein
MRVSGLDALGEGCEESERHGAHERLPVDRIAPSHRRAKERVIVVRASPHNTCDSKNYAPQGGARGPRSRPSDRLIAKGTWGRR